MLQTVYTEPLSNIFLRARLSRIADVDGDGREEVALSARVLSCSTGATLWHDPDAGVAAGLGDIDGDGVNDFAYPSTHLKLTVISGHGLERLSRFRGRPDEGAIAIVGLGDVNRDGAADFAVIMHPPLEPRYLQAFSGIDGAILWRFHFEETTDERYYVWAARAIGDMDSDGCLDVAVGVLKPRSDGGSADSGRVYLISGSDGSEIAYIPGAPGIKLGSHVFGLGSAQTGLAPGFAVCDLTGIYIYEGAQWSTSRKIPLLSEDYLITALDYGSDLDHDGQRDLLVRYEYRGDTAGKPFLAGGGGLALLSGDDGALLASIPLECDEPRQSTACFVGDQDADGCEDVVVAIPRAEWTEVTVLSGARWASEGAHEPFPPAR